MPYLDLSLLGATTLLHLIHLAVSGSYNFLPLKLSSLKIYLNPLSISIWLSSFLISSFPLSPLFCILHNTSFLLIHFALLTLFGNLSLTLYLCVSSNKLLEKYTPTIQDDVNAWVWNNRKSCFRQGSLRVFSVCYVVCALLWQGWWTYASTGFTWEGMATCEHKFGFKAVGFLPIFLLNIYLCYCLYRCKGVNPFQTRTLSVIGGGFFHLFIFLFLHNLYSSFQAGVWLLIQDLCFIGFSFAFFVYPLIHARKLKAKAAKYKQSGSPSAYLEEYQERGFLCFLAYSIQENVIDLICFYECRKCEAEFNHIHRSNDDDKGSHVALSRGHSSDAFLARAQPLIEYFDENNFPFVPLSKRNLDPLIEWIRERPLHIQSSPTQFAILEEDEENNNTNLPLEQQPLQKLSTSSSSSQIHHHKQQQQRHHRSIALKRIGLGVDSDVPTKIRKTDGLYEQIQTEIPPREQHPLKGVVEELSTRLHGQWCRFMQSEFQKGDIPVPIVSATDSMHSTSSNANIKREGKREGKREHIQHLNIVVDPADVAQESPVVDRPSHPKTPFLQVPKRGYELIPQDGSPLDAPHSSQTHIRYPDSDSEISPTPLKNVTTTAATILTTKHFARNQSHHHRSSSVSSLSPLISTSAPSSPTTSSALASTSTTTSLLIPTSDRLISPSKMATSGLSLILPLSPHHAHLSPPPSSTATTAFPSPATSPNNGNPRYFFAKKEPSSSSFSSSGSSSTTPIYPPSSSSSLSQKKKSSTPLQSGGSFRQPPLSTIPPEEEREAEEDITESSTLATSFPLAHPWSSSSPPLALSSESKHQLFIGQSPPLSLTFGSKIDEEIVEEEEDTEAEPEPKPRTVRRLLKIPKVKDEEYIYLQDTYLSSPIILDAVKQVRILGKYKKQLTRTWDSSPDPSSAVEELEKTWRSKEDKTKQAFVNLQAHNRELDVFVKKMESLLPNLAASLDEQSKDSIKVPSETLPSET